MTSVIHVYARPAPGVYDDEPWELAAVYRVTFWEQPGMLPEPAYHPRSIHGLMSTLPRP